MGRVRIDGNQITGAGGGRWVWWRLDQCDTTGGWNYLSGSARQARVDRFAQLLTGLSGERLHVIDTAIPSPVSAWHSDLVAAATDVRYRRALADATANSLDAVASVPATFIGVELGRKERRTDARTVARYSATIAGLGASVPATEVELGWLVAHHHLRGIVDLAASTQVSVDAPLVRERGQLVRRHPSGDVFTQWVAFASCGGDLAGHDWGRWHQQRPNRDLPVELRPHVEIDMHLHVTLTPAAEGAAMARKSATTASESLQQFRLVGRNADTDSTDSARMLPEIEAELIRTGQPLVEASIFYAVTALTATDCADATDQLVERFRHHGIGLVPVPARELIAVHAGAEPAARRQHRGWPQRMPVRTLAAADIGITNGTGDERGPAIGWSPTHPVRLELLAGSRLSGGNVSLFVGLMGGGKTFSTILASLWAFFDGVSIIDIDPQGDTARIGNIIGLDRVNTVAFGTGAHPGVADPYWALRADTTTGESTDPALVAADIVRELIPHLWDDHQSAVLAACTAERDNHERPATLTGVTERLVDEHSPAGHALAAVSQLAAATALFADPDNPPPVLETRGRWTRVSLDGINLDANADTMSGQVARAIMTALAAVVTDHGYGSKTERVVIRWDELHLFLNTPRATAELVRLGLTGRKYSVGVVGATQLWRHVPDAVREIVSNVFAFRAEREELATDMCTALGIDDAYHPHLTALPEGSGQALWRNRRNEVQRIQFDPVNHHWYTALDSTPDDTEPDPEVDIDGDVEVGVDGEVDAEFVA